ncbi:segregation/condensation protein A [Streptomyces sp. LP05-1]|uniref:Segregation and condensation protein A n=1 Tax=Streptomyces pyxinae TaxID=2970734 RepID=A0ABT2CLL1_9ACTN|nr:segregation/condensation protein A [Streptomyces sp. LP05-1]MCS0638305.1 segregation/condensation protein A [Streptomyces sp. LP05-1]
MIHRPSDEADSDSGPGSDSAAGSRRRPLGRGPGSRPPAEPPAAEPAAAEPAVPAPPEPYAPPEPEAPAGAGPEAPAPGAPEPYDPSEAPEPGAPEPYAPREEPAPVARQTPAASGPERPEAPETREAPQGAGPGAAAGDGRFTVRLANFEGPFDLLLQLITRHKMDVTEVALSRVTDEFMAHIRAMGPDWDLDQTTEFLVVAATLLDLKTARLLPAAEVEDEADLALLEARDLLFARLLQYRAYKKVADIFGERMADEGRRYPRTVGLEPHHAELLPDVVISIGAEGLAGLAVKAMQPRARPQVYVDHIHAPLVSVQEQAAVVLARLRERGTATFRELAGDAPDTLTVVARFLALLELYRERAVTLDQEAALGELTVGWTGAESAGVTDEFDRAPGRRRQEEREEQKEEEERDA